MMLNIALGGARGRMGQSLQRIIHHQDEVAYAGSIFDEQYQVNMDVQNKADVMIDFSTPDGTQQLLQHVNKPLLICTTGHTAPLIPALSIPVLYAPNTSMGIHLLRRALQVVAPHIGDGDIDIVETHHKYKKDKPSGTALSLQAMLSPLTSHHTSVNIHAIRSGSVLAEHEVRINWGEETLVLTHQSYSRDVFARGAIVLAKWLAKQKSGFYKMEDFFAGSSEQP